MFKLQALYLKKRSILWINPKFQMTFLGYMLGLAVVAIGVFYVANLYFFWKFEQIGLSLQLAPDHAFFSFLDEQRTVMNLVFAVTGAISFSAMVLGGIFLSHRVAGPLHRLALHMNAVAEDQSHSEVHFRKGDFFPELAASFNKQLRAHQEASEDPAA